MTPSYYLRKLKDVKVGDYLSFGKLFVAICIKPFLKEKYDHCWVICETPNEARDNGYSFFKHIKENNKDINCYYAINYGSPDYKKVSSYGSVIKYGSLKHWILYLCADYNISSQKGGKPNAAVCAFLELCHLIDSKFVFLQHGVIINDCAWAHADTTQLRFFITSTKQEKEYIDRFFGFKASQIILTGMPRFDNLHDVSVENNYILVMPTWRGRFTLKSERQKYDNDFSHSHYKLAWEMLINSKELAELIKAYNLKVVFFPHRNMQPFLSEFNFINDDIVIANWENYDIQEELKKAALMITDYSSVFFDMIYMKKPVVFYQFDYEEFRKYDYEEGYFDYKRNPFGEWCGSPDKVLSALRHYLYNDMRVSDDYIKEYSNTFPFDDSNNSERIVQILKKGAK